MKLMQKYAVHLAGFGLTRKQEKPVKYEREKRVFLRYVNYIRFLLGISCLCFCCPLFATTYKLTDQGPIIGSIQHTVIHKGDTLSRIARLFNVGYYELLEANPGIQPERLKPGSKLIIPSRYILPAVPHEGIVINLAEMRLYYFPPDGEQVVTFPVGIGRVDWETPLGSMRIIDKRKNPTWFVPDSIRAARAAEGILLPTSLPPGPDNPLGQYAMRLSKRSYLIHGTNAPDGIGRRSTSGCIRLYPEDIAFLFTQVSRGTRVRIIDHTYKLAWFNHQLYLEVHEPLQEHRPEHMFLSAVDLVKTAIRDKENIHVDWPAVSTVVHWQSGIPVSVTYDKQVRHDQAITQRR